MPTLVYIGQTPAEGTGSPVILLRHLRRCALSGWKIVIIGENGQTTDACSDWPVIRLPLRRWWWPPYRSELTLSRTLRTWLLAREARRLLAPYAPDALLGYLAAHGDFSAEIAARLARSTALPLTLLVHDDSAAFARDPAHKARLRQRHAWIIRQSYRSWFASPELAAIYDIPSKFQHVLPPIPAGEKHIVPRKFADGRPRVYYAGHLWPAQLPLLEDIARRLDKGGARLVIQSRDGAELRRFLATHPADWVPPFASNQEALAHLFQDASAVLISYANTTASMPWSATSFPSKFIEYSHLGLPCAIVAPVDTAISRWAVAHDFSHCFNPPDLDAFDAWIATLSDPVAWERQAAVMREFAANHFDPVALHARLESALLGRRPGHVDVPSLR